MIRIPLSFMDYTHSLRDLKQSGMAFISSVHSQDSVTIPKLSVKLVNSASCHPFEGKLLLPGEAAKLVLSETIKPLRINSGTNQIPPPRYFVEQFEGELWHFDVKSAYASIYRRIEAEIMFTGSRIFPGWSELEPAYQRIKDYKAARNAIPGLMIASSFAVNRGDKQTKVHKPSKFYNPNIYNLCNYYMHRLARIALDSCACQYWNTDGGFLFVIEPMIEAVESMGFKYTLDRGNVRLNYWGCYEFIGKSGQVTTKGKFMNRPFNFKIDNIARF